MKHFYLFLCCLISGFISPQTFSISVNSPITDNGISTYTLNVAGLPPKMDLPGTGIEFAKINLNHQRDGDLVIILQSPGGFQVKLASNNGGTGTNFTNTTFLDTIPVNINYGVAPFNNSFAPYQALSNFNNGINNPNGKWKLIVQDVAPTKTGMLLSWGITFSTKPAGKVSFYSSNLPIAVINTGTNQIINGAKVTATLGIINYGPGNLNYINNSFNDYNGCIGIEIRGQSSTTFPQKQYGFETRDLLGNNQNVSLLGLPPENDWILYAPYNDKSLMRNFLAYSLARNMGQYASRCRYCELILNGVYMGIYILEEKIKRDASRVNISKLLPADTSGSALTGGYIINIDKDPASWYSAISPNFSNNNQKIRFTCNYPDTLAIMPKQRAYIKNYVDSFETALNGPNFQDPLIGYRRYASLKTLVDYFIVNECSKNVDGYRLSTYLYKEKITSGGQLKIGPVWDYNLAFYNANYCNGNTSNGWAYEFNTSCPGDTWQVPFWWDRLMQDSAFKTKLVCRYNQLRLTFLDTLNFFSNIDSITGLVSTAQQRQFKRYAILGTYVWPNPIPYAKTYTEEIRNMKNWVKARLNWLDININNLAVCPSPIVTGVNAGRKENETSIGIYPNPFQNSAAITISIPKKGDYTLSLYDSKGKLIKIICQETLNKDEYYFYQDNLAGLTGGIYLLRLHQPGGINKAVKLVKE